MKMNRRIFSRVDLTLVVQITFPNNPNQLFLGKDISLSGIFIATHLNIGSYDNCLVELDYNQPDGHINRVIFGKVVRKNNNGFGIQFIRMDYETHMMLQTRLLYSCSDPSILCEEFSGSCPVSIKEKSGSSQLSVVELSN